MAAHALCHRDWLESPPGQLFINSFPNATEELSELRGLLGELRELRDNNTALEDAIEQSGFQTIFQVWKVGAGCCAPLTGLPMTAWQDVGLLRPS